MAHTYVRLFSCQNVYCVLGLSLDMNFLAPIYESDDIDLYLTVEQDCESVEPNSNVLVKPSKMKK